MIITLPGADFSSKHKGVLNDWFITPIIGVGAHYNGPKSVSKDEDISAITITFDTDYTIAENGLSIKTINNEEVSYTATFNKTNAIIQIADITNHIIIKVSTINIATGVSYTGNSIFVMNDMAFVKDNDNWILKIPDYDNYRNTNLIPVNSDNSIWIDPIVLGENQNIAIGRVADSTALSVSVGRPIHPIYWGSFGITAQEAKSLVAQGNMVVPKDYNYGPISIASLEEEYNMSIKGVSFQAFGKSRFDTTTAIVYGDPHLTEVQFITKNRALKQYDNGSFTEVEIDSGNTTYMSGNYAVTADSRVYISEVFIKNNTWPCVGLYGSNGEKLLGVVTPSDFGLSIDSTLSGAEAFAPPEIWPRISDLKKNKNITEDIAYVRFVAWSSSTSGKNTQARVYEW